MGVPTHDFFKSYCPGFIFPASDTSYTFLFLFYFSKWAPIYVKQRLIPPRSPQTGYSVHIRSPALERKQEIGLLLSPDWTTLHPGGKAKIIASKNPTNFSFVLNIAFRWLSIKLVAVDFNIFQRAYKVTLANFQFSSIIFNISQGEGRPGAYWSATCSCYPEYPKACFGFFLSCETTTGAM